MLIRGMKGWFRVLCRSVGMSNSGTAVPLLGSSVGNTKWKGKLESLHCKCMCLYTEVQQMSAVNTSWCLRLAFRVRCSATCSCCCNWYKADHGSCGSDQIHTVHSHCGFGKALVAGLSLPAQAIDQTYFSRQSVGVQQSSQKCWVMASCSCAC